MIPSALKSFDISNKVAVVTGGRSGLGKGIALGLLSAGANVAVISRSEYPDELLNEASRISDRKILYIPADLAKRTQRIGLIRQVIDHFGKIDILINNAGVQTKSPISEYKSRHWNNDIELLLTAVFDLSKQALNPMRMNGGGKIVNIASISSFQGARNISGYAAAKHGLLGLTKCLAIEFAPHNIQVNSVAPGQFNTGLFLKNTLNESQINDITSRIPEKRLGEIQDLIGAIHFLCSDASNYITGISLPVDGGWLSR